MRIEIAQEIKKAISQGKTYTDIRKFIDKTEQEEYNKCSCGYTAEYISYCTIYPVVVTLCNKCKQMEDLRE